VDLVKSDSDNMEKINTDYGRCRINSQLTRRIIDLHDQGYGLDFGINQCRGIVCLQDNREFGLAGVQVRIVDQVYDQFSHSYKYIHTIQTSCGEQGLLIADTFISTAAIAADTPDSDELHIPWFLKWNRNSLRLRSQA